MSSDKKRKEAEQAWRLARDACLLADMNWALAVKSKKSIVDSFQNVMGLSRDQAKLQYLKIVEQHRLELSNAIKRLGSTGEALRKILELDALS